MNVRRSQPTKINSIINSNLAKNPLFIVLQNWHSLVGDIIFKVAVPVKFKNSTLLVGVTTHSWVQELILNKHILMKRIKELTDEIKDIKFAIKSDLVGLQRNDFQNKESNARLERKPLSSNLMQYIMDVSSTIEDAELRDILYNTMYDAMSLDISK